MAASTRRHAAEVARLQADLDVARSSGVSRSYDAEALKSEVKAKESLCIQLEAQLAAALTNAKQEAQVWP